MASSASTARATRCTGGRIRSAGRRVLQGASVDAAGNRLVEDPSHPSDGGSRRSLHADRGVLHVRRESAAAGARPAAARRGVGRRDRRLPLGVVALVRQRPRVLQRARPLLRDLDRSALPAAGRRRDPLGRGPLMIGLVEVAERISRRGAGDAEKIARRDIGLSRPSSLLWSFCVLAPLRENFSRASSKQRGSRRKCLKRLQLQEQRVNNMTPAERHANTGRAWHRMSGRRTRHSTSSLVHGSHQPSKGARR